ncbi:MAG TPA: hypothetical protein PLX59_06725 [Candidatus Cloacimonadota bacterium]|mgnify:CR=1 FL=1|nr:hypothetical protein [Candidatus Cloacimonadota bacterium]
MPGKANTNKASGYNWRDLVLIHRADKPGLSLEISGLILRLRKSKGADYLYEVLSHPHQSISALQLGHLYNCPGKIRSLSAGQDLLEQGLSFDDSYIPDPAMDARGIREIKERLVWLNERCAELISWNDDAVLEELNTEREQLIQYLSEALYPDGRPRRLENEQVRLIIAVNKSVKRCLEQLFRQHRKLGKALMSCVHLGRYIGFYPD